MAKSIGFSVSELYELSIGQVLDQVAEYVNAHSEHKNQIRRVATQDDFDRF